MGRPALRNRAVGQRKIRKPARELPDQDRKGFVEARILRPDQCLVVRFFRNVKRGADISHAEPE